MKLSKKYSLKDLALEYKCQTVGNENVVFDTISSLSEPKDNAVSYLANAKNLHYLKNTNIACLITTKILSENLKIPMILTDNPHLLFCELVTSNLSSRSGKFFDTKKEKFSDLYQKVTIAEHVSIGDNVVIGKNTIIYPNVTIYDNCVIGENVIIHSGAVIGSDGFGLIKNADSWIKVPHIGNVILGNNVEIGANTAIDRGSIDSTKLCDNVKIDNLVHIAHNVRIGENTAIAACVGIAGSTSIGRNCTIGGGTGINGHINIVDDVHIHGMTMVTKSINNPGMYASGTTIEPADSWRKNQARFKELDSLAREIKKKQK